MTSTSDDAETRVPDEHSRRRVLTLGCSVALAAVAGCSSGGSAPTPDPVAVSDGAQCDACGMVVTENPGPTGEIFYREDRPTAHDGPARFDSLRGCLFPYYFEHERRDWEALAVYVTDYSAVDYSLTTAESKTFVSRHADADSFTDAREAHFVVGGEAYGAMGADLVPFSVESDATAFADEHGGRVLAFDEVTPEVLSR
jgi:nitrous oxide reductase accessory protein NosL